MDETAIDLSERARARVAEHWTKIGLMEHASIAAFARFTLQLLSVGAPSELIEASNQAQQDETKHTQMAFALASRYAERPVGPGKLPLEGALDDMSLEHILRMTIAEGCVGETRAALEASEAARQATDPLVKKALQQIAKDEGQHAALAWKVVRWILNENPKLISVARREFLNVQRVTHLGTGLTLAEENAAAGHGLLSPSELTRVYNEADREVVAPCFLALQEELAFPQPVPGPRNTRRQKRARFNTTPETPRARAKAMRGRTLRDCPEALREAEA